MFSLDRSVRHDQSRPLRECRPRLAGKSHQCVQRRVPTTIEGLASRVLPTPRRGLGIIVVVDVSVVALAGHMMLFRCFWFFFASVDGATPSTSFAFFQCFLSFRALYSGIKCVRRYFTNDRWFTTEHVTL